MASTRVSLARADIKLLANSQSSLSSHLWKPSTSGPRNILCHSQRTHASYRQNTRLLHTTNSSNGTQGTSNTGSNTANKANLNATSPGLQGNGSDTQTAANSSTGGRRLIRAGPLNLTVLLLILSGVGWFGWVCRFYCVYEPEFISFLILFILHK
jgi:hypothetical protein